MDYSSVFLVVSFFLEVTSLQAEDAPLVTTRVGQIKGTVKEINVYGKQMRVFNYFGIPYAEAPVGDLRFRKPVPKRPFTTAFNATRHGSVCLQMTRPQDQGSAVL